MRSQEASGSWQRGKPYGAYFGESWSQVPLDSIRRSGTVEPAPEHGRQAGCDEGELSRENCLASWLFDFLTGDLGGTLARRSGTVDAAPAHDKEPRMKNASKRCAVAAMILVAIPGCDVPVVLSFDFNQGAQEWSSHFADLPPDFDPTLYELSAEVAALPSELGPGTGFLVGGTNRSDDLWMGLERQVGTEAGIEPNRSYRVAYEIQFGSNAPTGCFGVGGAPGESVYLKAGAASVDPEPISVPNDDFLRLNIDKGNQAQGGSNASVVSDIANGIPCDEGDGPYVSLHRTHEHPQVVTADAAGNLWLVVGTDSAFESRTELYYQSITVTLTPQ